MAFICTKVPKIEEACTRKACTGKAFPSYFSVGVTAVKYFTDLLISSEVFVSILKKKKQKQKLERFF